MKKFLRIAGVVGITALVTFLAVTKHFSDERNTRLRKDLMEADATIMSLETEVEGLRQQLQAANSGRAVSSPGNVGVGPGASTSSPANQTGTGSGTGQVSASVDRANGPSTPDTLVASTRYTARPGGSVRMEGTSSIHDWQVVGKLIGGSVEVPADFPSAPLPEGMSNPIAARASVFIPVRSLTSVKPDGSPYSTAMDDIMYGKLNAGAHDRITYHLEKLTFKERGKDNPSAWVYDAVGRLGVAGVTNAASFPITVTSEADNSLRFTGGTRVKMTDFGIAPPAPAFAGGAIKTGDEVTLSFVWIVRRNAPKP